MKHRVFDDATVLQMLDDDPLQELWRDVRVPDALGIHHEDRTAGTYAEAWSLAAFHSRRSEQQLLALEQSCQLGIDRATPPIR